MATTTREKPRRPILVGGTWSWRAQKGRPTAWCDPGSRFVDFLQRQNIDPIFGDLGDEPFVWSTDLDGVWGGRAKHRIWASAGQNLRHYLSPPMCKAATVPPDRLVLLTHSHGLQPALYALAAGLQAYALISLMGPIRADMMEVAKAARGNILHWIHVYSDETDIIQVLGSLWDGAVGVRRRQHPLARNVFIAGVGHEGIIENPNLFYLWHTYDLLWTMR